MSVDLALVGATGAVGRTALDILADRDFPIGRLRVMASARSAGQKISTTWGKVEVEDLEEADPEGIEIAIFSAGASRSRAYAPHFVAAGAVVIDNSSCFPDGPDSSAGGGGCERPCPGITSRNSRQPQLHHHGADDGGRPLSTGPQGPLDGYHLLSVGLRLGTEGDDRAFPPDRSLPG